MATQKYNVAMIGSGNWATAIAKVVAENVKHMPEFEDRVIMFCYEEEYMGINLTDWINNDHENPIYLKGVKLPDNLHAMPDIVNSVRTADFVIFCIPKYFVINCCRTLMGRLKPTAVAIVLGRHLVRVARGGVGLTSQMVMSNLKIPCSVFTGSNLATHIVKNIFSDITIGCRDPNVGKIWKRLFQNEVTRVVVTTDVHGVELCSGLKTIVALAAGISDGLHTNENYKPAIIRFGLQEMIRFVDIFFTECKLETFFHSCGIADLIVSCYGSRDRLLGEIMVEKRKPVVRLQEEYLDGQQVPGPPLSRNIHTMIKQKGIEEKFPIFNAVYKIISFRERPEYLLDKVLNASVDVYHPVNLAQR